MIKAMSITEFVNLQRGGAMFRVLLLFPFLVTVGLAAPVPKQPPRPSAEMLRQAVNKSHIGKEVRAIGRALGEDPVIRYEFWHHEDPGDTEEVHFELKWKSKGLLLYFCRGNMHTAWMYNDKVDGYKRYIGELPEKLSFGDTLATVEKKLGKPDVVFRTSPERKPEKNADLQTDYIYKKLGVCVSFTKPKSDIEVIRAIAIFPFDDAPSW